MGFICSFRHAPFTISAIAGEIVRIARAE